MTGPEPASGILESSVLGPIGIQLNSQLIKSWINLRPCGLSPNNLKSEIWNRPPELIWPAGSQSCNPHFCSDPDFDIIVTISNSGQKCSQDLATMAVWCHHGCSTSWLFDATMTTHKKCFWFSAAASVARLGPQTTVSCQLKKVLNYILFLIDVLQGLSFSVIVMELSQTSQKGPELSVVCFLTVCF